MQVLLLRDPRQRQQRQQPCGGRHRSARLGPARRRRGTGLDQAAEIDGCSTLRIFGQIIVPLMMPAVATVAVLGFMDFWNDFFAPFIYLNNVDKDTIVLRLFRIWSDVEGYMREELHTVMAGNVMVTLPGFIIFFIAQKRFIQGIVTTGIKG